MIAVGHWYVFVVFLLFWGGVIALILWAIRRATSSRGPDSAIQILQERFARGEIDQQEFEQRKSALRR
ncbi:MAG: SHOCT domain-containing protein [Candidatus Dormibacter sp.]